MFSRSLRLAQEKGQHFALFFDPVQRKRSPYEAFPHLQGRTTGIGNRTTEVRNRGARYVPRSFSEAKMTTRDTCRLRARARPTLSGTVSGGRSTRSGRSRRPYAKPHLRPVGRRNLHPHWRRAHDRGGGSCIVETAPAKGMEATPPQEEATLRTAPRGGTG